MPPENNLPVNIEDEMRDAYLSYAMSVIVGRALPDVRDGLKPVHRRVLFAMQELGNHFNRAYKKSARVVGDVIGKYHPHGDQAVYDTIVRMAQDFSMRHLLVDGQGNFGSVDGDPPAAMRYTEVRMARLSGEMLADIDKETVDFNANYDDSLQEPSVLPTRFPNLLVNGASGIAVGMATNIPPHNLTEVIDGAVALAENPALKVTDLMQFIKGPDFPTAGIIYGTHNLRTAYETGRGIIKVRGRANIEEGKRNERIVISELPYQVNKANLLEKIADLVRDKRLEGISDIRDESNRTGIRAVIELKRDANADVILNQLYSMTALQTSVGFNMLAIVKGQPQRLSLKALLQHFIDHRREVVTRRSLFELREAKKRFNVVFGLLAAIDVIDRIIEIIRAAPDTSVAKANLMAETLNLTPAFLTLAERLVTFDYPSGKEAIASKTIHLNERQAQAILDMRLSRLTGLERDKLAEEAEKLRDSIQELESILGSDTKLLEVVVAELRAIQTTYGNARKTELVADARQLSVEDLIADEDVVVTLSNAGYIKRVPMDTYRRQRRGGKGKTGAKTREEDYVTKVFTASTHSMVLVFSDRGKVYWLKVHTIPQGSRTAKGKPIVNLIKLDKGESIAAVLPVRTFEEGHYLMFATAKGYVKKTELSAYAKPRPSGLIALTIDADDQLIRVAKTNGEQEILLASRQGMAIRFSEQNVRPMGRAARGVKGISLKKDGDAVVSMAVLSSDSLQKILAISDRGYGKRSALDEYRLQTRGGSGIINLKVTDKTGLVAGCAPATDDDELMIVSDGGMIIRLHAKDISTIGRSTQGVRMLDVATGESVASMTVFSADETSEQ